MNAAILVDDNGDHDVFADTEETVSVQLELVNECGVELTGCTAFVASLGLADDQVRVHPAGVGGAFGSREDVSLQIHLCLLAMHTGRPVKMVYDRAESFVGHVHRHPAKMWFRHEADEEERARQLHAVAVLGGPAAVECLRRHVGARRLSWFQGKKSNASRRAAILSLRDVTDEAVRAFLAEGESSRDRAFAEACRAVRVLSGTGEGRTR